ncbi:Homogentisate 1,2-dioxygenase [hydrothermal vent metagenome]|uniref:Homogentisate 1,2-dioxygenase n=1 Tax=hydrothermal vent metagenome TaxID=652676 RepID=A0A3B0WQW2_9ZZZZ
MNGKWFNFYKKQGKVAKQAHLGFPEGSYEREMGKEGFFGPVTHFYHTKKHTGWTAFDGDIRPRAFDTNLFGSSQETPWDAHVLLKNNSVKVRMWSLNSNMNNLVRNADGDDLLFFHQGTADLYCDFGHLVVKEGDYLMLPKGTMWRLESSNPCEILMIESTNGHYQLPDKGLLGPNAIVDAAVYRTPEINDDFKAQYSDEDWTVQVKRLQKISTINYPFNPLDAIGWQGDLMPVALNWRDISPVMSHRFHVPPSAHTTFLGNRFIVCTFVPRLFETDPEALKVPFYHNNDDFDEVLFYHSGNFFSRDNINPGMITLHPTGFTHGPHPKAMKNAFTQKNAMTEEVAVMIDTRDPLEVCDAAEQIEWPEYVNSWQEQK